MYTEEEKPAQSISLKNVNPGIKKPGQRFLRKNKMDIAQLKWGFNNDEEEFPKIENEDLRDYFERYLENNGEFYAFTLSDALRAFDQDSEFRDKLEIMKKDKEIIEEYKIRSLTHKSAEKWKKDTKFDKEPGEKEIDLEARKKTLNEKRIKKNTEVYRGASRSPLEMINGGGFIPKGGEFDPLKLNEKSWKKFIGADLGQSGDVGTSTSVSSKAAAVWASQRSNEGGYLYKIIINPKHVAVSFYNNSDEANEVNVATVIRPGDIVAAWKVFANGKVSKENLLPENTAVYQKDQKNEEPGTKCNICQIF